MPPTQEWGLGWGGGGGGWVGGWSQQLGKNGKNVY